MLFFYSKKNRWFDIKGEKMLDEKICLLREKLNDSILNGEDYNIIYQISIELDELIDKYYIQTAQKGTI